MALKHEKLCVASSFEYLKKKARKSLQCCKKSSKADDSDGNWNARMLTEMLSAITVFIRFQMEMGTLLEPD